MHRRLFFVATALLPLSCAEDEAAQAEESDQGSGGAGGETAGVDATSGGPGGGAGGDAAAPDASAPDAANPDAALPNPAGYRVGYRVSELKYQPEGVEGERHLRLAFWYPTTDAEGPAASYLFGRIMHPEVFTDASLAPGRFPVLLFSHGSGGFAVQSPSFTEFFASQGFVVAAPDHTGNTFSDDGGLSPEMFALRPQDVSATLDFVTNDDPTLKDRLTEEVIVAGHSFGGYTALSSVGLGFDLEAVDAYCAQASDALLCDLVDDAALRSLFELGFLEPRIKAAISMTPVGGPAYRPQDIALPVLLLTASRDETLPEPIHGDAVWQGLDGEHDRRVVFQEAGHYTFTDICHELPGLLMGDGCAADNLDPLLAHEITNAYSMAFARKHLFGETAGDALLDCVEVPWPEGQCYKHP